MIFIVETWELTGYAWTQFKKLYFLRKSFPLSIWNSLIRWILTLFTAQQSSPYFHSTLLLTTSIQLAIFLSLLFHSHTSCYIRPKYVKSRFYMINSLSNASILIPKFILYASATFITFFFFEIELSPPFSIKSEPKLNCSWLDHYNFLLSQNLL